MKQSIKKLLDDAHEALCSGNIPTAFSCYQQVINLNPNDDTSLHFFAFFHNIQGKYSIALELAKKAIEIYQCNASYYLTLANILRNLNQYPEAVEAVRTACELRPRDAVAFSNAAMILTDERKYDRAKELYEYALSIEPNNSFIHFNYSLLLLSLGEFKKGWQEYEWRIPFHYGRPLPTYPDLKGKKVQIIPEQGYGDFIMFSRYFQSLEQSGAEVYIDCPKALSKLYDCHYCPDPDFSIHVMSLASLFDEIPNKPYIKAPGKVEISNPGFKIGVATKGVKQYNNEVQVIQKNDHVQIIPHPANAAYLSASKRSLPHDFFDGIPNVYNLQIDVPSYGMIDLKDQVKNFADLADVIDQMDLIITIDTAVAHLAGAMGKKTWLLLPYDFDWRWQNERKDSPWYPSIEITRQEKRGDWSNVQKKVLKDLT